MNQERAQRLRILSRKNRGRLAVDGYLEELRIAGVVLPETELLSLEESDAIMSARSAREYQLTLKLEVLVSERIRFVTALQAFLEDEDFSASFLWSPKLEYLGLIQLSAFTLDAATLLNLLHIKSHSGQFALLGTTKDVELDIDEDYFGNRYREIYTLKIKEKS